MGVCIFRCFPNHMMRTKTKACWPFCIWIWIVLKSLMTRWGMPQVTACCKMWQSACSRGAQSEIASNCRGCGVGGPACVSKATTLPSRARVFVQRAGSRQQYGNHAPANRQQKGASLDFKAAPFFMDHFYYSTCCKNPSSRSIAFARLSSDTAYEIRILLGAPKPSPGTRAMFAFSSKREAKVLAESISVPS